MAQSHNSVIFLVSNIYVTFGPQKCSPLRGDFFLWWIGFYNENTYKKAPQAIFFGYRTSNITISFTKFVENTEFLPKFHINSQNIYGIFGAGPKISTIYMEIPYMNIVLSKSKVLKTFLDMPPIYLFRPPYISF